MQIVTRNGQTLLVRRVQPSDGPLIVRFFHGLSAQTRWQRFFRSYQGVSFLWVRQEARRIARIRPQRQIALLALSTPPHRKRPLVVAGVQVIRTIRDGPEAEIAIVIADAFQRQGIGLQLAQLACDEAQNEGITQLIATMHAENEGMWRLLVKLGYPLRSTVSQGERSVTIRLG